MEMPFGKHKGTNLSDVPKHYLLWILDNGEIDSPTLKAEIKKILGLEPSTASGSRPSVEELRPVYRRMASKHHPDRGGSTEAMVAINDFWENLCNVLDRPSGDDFFT